MMGCGGLIFVYMFLLCFVVREGVACTYVVVARSGFSVPLSALPSASCPRGANVMFRLVLTGEGHLV